MCISDVQGVTHSTKSNNNNLVSFGAYWSIASRETPVASEEVAQIITVLSPGTLQNRRELGYSLPYQWILIKDLISQPKSIITLIWSIHLHIERWNMECGRGCRHSTFLCHQNNWTLKYNRLAEFEFTTKQVPKYNSVYNLSGLRCAWPTYHHRVIGLRNRDHTTNH